MGCLKNITRSIFLTVIIVGFITFGGQSWVKSLVGNFFNPSHDTILEKAQKIGDFSNIDKEFEIEKAASLLGYNAVIAEHKASGQKMIVIDSAKKTILSKDDITSSDAEQRIKDTIHKFKYQSMAIEDFHLTDKGTMQSYGQEVPYVKFSARVKKLPIGEISGIISVVKDKDNHDKVLVSANQGEKYSQLITNEFFKQIK